MSDRLDREPVCDAPARTCPRGFTLLELLICISIIITLVAILMPMLAHARESAQAAACQSNLRQIMLAFRSFSLDHEESLPGSYYDLQSATAEPWQKDWLRGDWTQWSSAPAGGTLFPYVNQAARIYRCPALDANPPSLTSQIGPGSGSNGNYDYVSMLEFAGAHIAGIKQQSNLTWPDGHISFEATPVILEGSPAVLNGFGMVSWHASTHPMSHTHRNGAYYASIDGAVHWINEPPGGCVNWSTQGPSGAWHNLGNYPFTFGAWNRQ